MEHEIKKDKPRGICLFYSYLSPKWGIKLNEFMSEALDADGDADRSE